MRNAEKDGIEMTARRERMLAAGFRLFSERGIQPVTMQDIADACDVGVATVYRYFNTKLSLVIAVGTREWEKIAEEARRTAQARGTAGMTAAQQFEFFLDFYLVLYREHKDLLRFNQFFNNFVQHEGATQAELLPYLQVVGGFADMFHGLYERGRADGTLRTDVSEDEMFTVSTHIMLAVVVRFAQGLLYSAENEQDRTRECLLLKRMLLREYVVSPEGAA